MRGCVIVYNSLARRRIRLTTNVDPLDTQPPGLPEHFYLAEVNRP